MGTDAISPLRQRMIEDMSARHLTPPTQKGHIRACKRFAAFLKRSPAALIPTIRKSIHRGDGTTPNAWRSAHDAAAGVDLLQ